jgi:formylglycine-generating enzyme
MSAPDVRAVEEVDGMVWIAGGRFRMGSDRHYADERPAHTVEVDGFWMDRYAVTNRQFARFVRETGYVTTAERPPRAEDYPGAAAELLVPGSAVFVQPSGPVDLGDCLSWWSYVPGACWRAPEGPGSDVAGRQEHPVVHVTYDDVAAYAAWAGKAIPTEAEWERAARGGLEGAEFCWGDERAPGGRIMANHWQGQFPWQNLARQDAGGGYERTAPVGSFPPNGYGLHDMAGNVWEWTSDWYVPGHRLERRPSDGARAGSAGCSAPHNPRGPAEAASLDPRTPHVRIPRKVLKGGSFLCADSYCFRYRPAARYPQTVDTSACHVGFRLLSRAAGPR